jgi:hypothetical protein
MEHEVSIVYGTNLHVDLTRSQTNIVKNGICPVYIHATGT